MPKSRREKPLYQRGEFRLYPRAGRNHEIIWYDGKRERSASAGTTDDQLAKAATDRLYVERHGGVPVCPTCQRPLDQRGAPVTVLVANYLETRPAGDAMHSRLAHVLGFQAATGRIEDTVDRVDDSWATSFRNWMKGRTDRERAPGTIENSLIGLAAAFRLGKVEPGFSTIPTTEINRTPVYRASIEQIAAMFRYCLYPDGTEAWQARHRKHRAALLRYLQAAVATWARPDAVHDINTDPKRRQWVSGARVLALNPDGRKQTKKYRPTIPVAHQFATLLDARPGFYVGVASVKSAWETMADSLGLPGDGEGGMKLIRRSVSQIARKRIGEERWVQGQMMLGHRKASTSDIYALPDPANLGLGLAVTEAIIDEIEAFVPGSFTAPLPQRQPVLRSIAGGKNG